MTWKYGQKHECWKITTNVLELALSVFSSSQPTFVQLKNKVMELITVDVSFGTSILRIVSIPVHDLQRLNGMRRHYVAVLIFSTKFCQFFCLLFLPVLLKALLRWSMLCYIILLELPLLLHAFPL